MTDSLVPYYIKWVTTLWTDGINQNAGVQNFRLTYENAEFRIRMDLTRRKTALDRSEKTELGSDPGKPTGSGIYEDPGPADRTVGIVSTRCPRNYRKSVL